MSGALVGFRINGEKKLQRLHGERTCEGVLAELLDYLRRITDAQLRAYAHLLKPVGPTHSPFPGEDDKVALGPFFARQDDSSPVPFTWAQAFAAFPGLEGWRAELPFMPAAALDTCADVAWGFLIDLDAGELQVYGNRHARFPWREMACPQPATCVLPLSHLRELTAHDLASLSELLRQQAYSDGNDPVLPLSDGVSPPFPGPGAWQARLQFVRGRVRLLLEHGRVLARVRRVGELRLDDPHCGTLLREALDPHVLALVLAIYGPRAHLGQMALVATHLPSLPFAPESSGLPLLDLALRPDNGLALTLGPGFFDDVRQRLLDSGMSAQGWRFLVKQEHDALRLLLDFFPPSARVLAGFSDLVNLLASALQSEPLRIDRCQPALRGVERILDRTRGRPDPVRRENARIFVRALMRAQLGPDDEANLGHDAQDVSDFAYTHADVLKGATWRSLSRRSVAWHRALLITVDPDRDVRWPALLPRFATGPFVALELDCGFLLAEEGLEQRHCIGTYVNACSSGASRVFSLRRNDKRTATIELQRGGDGAWHLVQIRGKANSIVSDPAVLAAGAAVAQAYAQAARSERTAPPDRRHQALQPGAYVPPGYLIHRQEHWTG